jgi:hypothetical protein
MVLEMLIRDPKKNSQSSCLLGLFVILGLVGCAMTPEKPLLSDFTALLGQPAVSPWGRNFKISSIAETEGQRFSIYTAATSCDDGSGTLFVDGPTGRIEPTRQVVVRGPRPEDRLFTRLCAAGLPLVDNAMRYQSNNSGSGSQMSPEERAVILQHFLNQVSPLRSR